MNDYSFYYFSIDGT